METESLPELMAILALQLAIIIFAVRIFGKLAKKAGFPQVLGELIAGIFIGPYALGGIGLPGFPQGLFPLNPGTMPVSNELYAFATIASIILLFTSGLETNLRLFLKYSLAGGLISIGGVLVSFVVGSFAGMILFHTSFSDPKCMFLGLFIASNSLGIIARILSDQKKMDSPEGVTILAASVFDDVYAIVALAVVMGIVAVITSSGAGSSSGLDVVKILAIAGKAFGIWLGATIIALVLSKRVAFFLKLFKRAYEFSIVALGIALLLAGLFEHNGLAMIIGAYIAGLAFSRTDIAPVIHDRLIALNEFFVPVFFAVMGMMVNFRDVLSLPVLAFGVAYAIAAILAKIIGCGFPALLLGFNLKGALRIGLGMAPRGEMTLILAGIGLALGVLTNQIFAVLVLMILITTLIAPSLLNAALKHPGRGTRKPVKSDDMASMTWKFSSSRIADLVKNTLFDDLRQEGFYVQVMNHNKSMCQIRKDDIFITVLEEDNALTAETKKADMQFIKTAVYEVIMELYDSIQNLKDSSNPEAMKEDILDSEGRARMDLLSRITPECILIDLKGETKEAVITELVDLLAVHGKLRDRDQVLEDVLERERVMSTAMKFGIALPHGKSNGVDDMVVALGIKKEGINFESMDGEKSRIFIMVASPKKTSGPHIQFLAAISSILKDSATREAIANASSAAEIMKLVHGHRNK